MPFVFGFKEQGLRDDGNQQRSTWVIWKHVVDRNFNRLWSMFKIAAKCCFLHETHRLIYVTGKAIIVLSFNPKLSVKGNYSSSFFCGKEINFIVFEIIITTVCAVRHVKSWQLTKGRQSNSNGEVFHKQASRYVVRHFQAKVSAHFNSPCLIVLVDIVNWFWKHLKAV